MIYKVLYQPSKTQAPRRETTQALFVEAESIKEVRKLLDANTPYNVEFIQALEGEFLDYERENNPDFEVVTF